MKKLLTCIVALLLSAHALADDKFSMPVSGAGAVSCGVFLKVKDTNATPSLRVFVAWTQGFLTATNAMNVRAGSPQDRTVDADSIEAYLTKDCREHPLDDVYQAVMRLHAELMTPR